MLSDTMLKKLELMWGIPIYFTKGPCQEMFGTGLSVREDSPLIASPELVEELIKIQDRQMLPVIYRYRETFWFFCMRSENDYYLSGPFCVQQLDFMEIHSFYRSCHLYGREETHPRIISSYEALNFISLLYELLTGNQISPYMLTSANHLTESPDVINGPGHAALVSFEQKRMDEDAYHHTYREERQTLDYVRDGRVKEVRERAEHLMDHAGVLSPNPIHNQRYLAVSGVTLATRAAIEGGVSPPEAYQMSDYLINEIDKMTRYEEITEAMLHAMVTFAQMVATQKDIRGTSYTNEVKHYVARNYHHKIYVQDIADAIGISQGHLARVFHADTGQKIQDYILEYRVKRAADLLLYSDMKLSEISAYVCFQSQSHFGSVFKKYMGMTPGAYRLKNGRQPV